MCHTAQAKGKEREFFFSSRRRHTRLTCDWSSDVCSSDLEAILDRPQHPQEPVAVALHLQHGVHQMLERSEERRVGKECRSRGAPNHQKKKNNFSVVIHADVSTESYVRKSSSSAGGNDVYH